MKITFRERSIRRKISFSEGCKNIPHHDDDYDYDVDDDYDVGGARGNDPISVCNRLRLHSIPHQCPPSSEDDDDNEDNDDDDDDGDDYDVCDSR